MVVGNVIAMMIEVNDGGDLVSRPDLPSLEQGGAYRVLPSDWPTLPRAGDPAVIWIRADAGWWDEIDPDTILWMESE